jgi:hypothetical protein
LELRRWVETDVVEDIAHGAVGCRRAEVVVEIGIRICFPSHQVVIDYIPLGLDFIPRAKTDHGLPVNRINRVVLCPVEGLKLGGVKSIVEATDVIGSDRWRRRVLGIEEGFDDVTDAIDAEIRIFDIKPGARNLEISRQTNIRRRAKDTVGNLVIG